MADYALVTLDVFDTLLLRSCNRPETVFSLVGREAVQSGALPPELCDESFVVMRREAEARARSRSRAAGGAGEVSLEAIYAELPLSLVSRERLMQLEVETETRVVQANPVMVSLIDQVRREGLPVWLVSDMYLGESRIRDLLAAAGIESDHYDRLYVSCDRGASKADGGLFQIILQSAGLPPGRILHIGDNLVSDVTVPRSLGIDARSFAPPVATREMVRREAFVGGRPESWITNARALAEAHQVDSEADPFWYSYGASVIGPPMESFACWVVDEAAARGIRHIAPFMREGRLLAPLMRRHAEERGLDMVVEPVFTSREALRRPALAELDSAELDRQATQNVVRTLRGLLRHLGIEPVPDWIDRWQDWRLIDLTSARDSADRLIWPQIKDYILAPDCLAAIKNRAAEARETAEAYFRAAFKGATHVATVDLGARGTTQSLLQRLPGVTRETRLDHFLFYALRSISQHRLDGCRFSIFTPETKAGYEFGELLFRTPYFIELLINGNEDTTKGYARQPDGGVVPVLGPGIRYAQQCKAIEACWRGVAAYAEHAATLKRSARYQPPVRDEVLGILRRAIQMPTPEEALKLGGLVYDFNDGTDFTRILCDDEALEAVASLDRLRPELRLKFALQQRPSVLPWPQGAITRRDPDAIERLIDASDGGVGIATVCRHILDQLQSAGLSSAILYAAGGAGGMGPTFLTLAAQRGISVEFYLDHLPGTVGSHFDGVPVIDLGRLAGVADRPIAVCSTGYGSQIVADIRRVCRGVGIEPRLFTLD